ncbi:zinc metalloproteinase nas-4-like isoform X1 [Penaeus japonicus]|uniref:zinc metalloproteinase nas-4-like isoform X1 n=1 Tax=Penaeus japonicus TaxID=27405 RepID=UPI001C715AD4|nr:zinc metalloproteinase nas-4-like isoform X1 [Penaeus japonicus]XP_042871756.1 zinc metalloproteinase nas-4-like isoform X1 [Penaeus japonicus]
MRAAIGLKSSLWLCVWACAWAEGSRSSDPNLQIVGEPQLDPDTMPMVPLGNPDTMENDIPGAPLSPKDFENSAHMIHEAIDTHQQADPIELAGLYQGDIILSPSDPAFSAMNDAAAPGLRNAMADMSRRWPNGVIPYVISSSYNTNERATIAMAIAQYHEKTCLRLVPRTIERDYIHILKGDGCSSSVGRVGGAQKVSLGPGCLYVGIVMHELMHVAGFWHEQSRQDRDNYITINKLNVQHGMWYNFAKYSWDKIQTLGVGYDTGSIMHYGPYAFAKDRSRPTIIPRQTGVEIGQRIGFSTKDILKLQKMYNCVDGGTEMAVTTTSPITTPSPDQCEDTSEYCTTWSDLGECQKNPTWMSVNCRKACRQCGAATGKECQDNNSYCAFWAESEECTKNAAYMTVYCKLSCGVCHSGEDYTPKCEDKHKYCSAWHKAGQCRANPNYMLIYCKKSCKQC